MERTTSHGIVAVAVVIHGSVFSKLAFPYLFVTLVGLQ